MTVSALCGVDTRHAYSADEKDEAKEQTYGSLDFDLSRNLLH